MMIDCPFCLEEIIMAISNAWKDKENEAGVAEATVITNLYNKINRLEELLSCPQP